MYGLFVAAFVYFRGRALAQGYPDLFGAALVGEAFGVVVTFTLVQVFVAMRSRPWRERAFPAALGVMLTEAAFLGFFVTY